MVSSCRRKVRRYLLGATQKATRVWWIGQVTVRVMAVVLDKGTRPVYAKADHGAEKSCRKQRRRKRGLRTKGRSRRPSRRSLEPPTSSKARGARFARHRRRKDDWLVRSSEGYRKDLESLHKLEVKLGKSTRYSVPGKLLRSAVGKCRLHCQAKWQHLAQRARELGYPARLSFGNSFKEYYALEFPAAWEQVSILPAQAMFGKSFWRPSLVSGGVIRLPASPMVAEPGFSTESFPPPTNLDPLPKKRGRGGRYSLRPVQNPTRVCRMCGYVGSGPHEFNSCRSDIGRSRGRGPRGQRGGTSRVRRCGCIRGSKCSH